MQPTHAAPHVSKVKGRVRAGYGAEKTGQHRQIGTSRQDGEQCLGFSVAPDISSIIKVVEATPTTSGHRSVYDLRQGERL